MKIEVEKEQIEQLCKSFAGSNFGDVMVVGGGVSGVQASLDRTVGIDKLSEHVKAYSPREGGQSDR